MADKPVNLNKARKAKARAERKREAEPKRVLHGLTKAERTAARAAHSQAGKQLDGKRRD